MLSFALILAAIAVPPATDQVTPPAKGKIVMYRSQSVFGLALACPIRYKQVELVELGRGKFAEWAIPAGRYILTNKTSSVEVHVDPGETRYVRCQVKTGFMSGRADLQIVDAEAFEPKRSEFEQKPVLGY